MSVSNKTVDISPVNAVVKPVPLPLTPKFWVCLEKGAVQLSISVWVKHHFTAMYDMYLEPWSSQIGMILKSVEKYLRIIPPMLILKYMDSQHP